MKYHYYPGCSAKSNGRAYEESLRAVFKALEVPLTELEDWNCCGATAYMSVDEVSAFTLAARNLALAERQGEGTEQTAAQLMAPCNACYLVLSKTQRYMDQHPDLGQQVNRGLEAVGLSYKGKVQIRHPLDVLVNDIGLERISRLAQHRLTGRKVVCYYGCQMVRPYATFDSAYNPMTMDRLVEALGATAVKWPLKTRCCGGTLIGTIPDTGLRLSHIILKEALRRGAELMVTVCPLCQFNLECYQNEMTRQFGEPVHLPVLYVTQLMGMAFGLPERDLGIQRLFVKPTRVPAPRKGGQAAHV